MAGNDVAAVTRVLAPGSWRFTVNQLFGNDNSVVSDASMTDGKVHARAITFSTIHEGKIVKQVEFWPEPFAPYADRAHLVELIHSCATAHT